MPPLAHQHEDDKWYSNKDEDPNCKPDGSRCGDGIHRCFGKRRRRKRRRRWGEHKSHGRDPINYSRMAWVGMQTCVRWNWNWWNGNGKSSRTLNDLGSIRLMWPWKWRRHIWIVRFNSLSRTGRTWGNARWEWCYGKFGLYYAIRTATRLNNAACIRLEGPNLAIPLLLPRYPREG